MKFSRTVLITFLVILSAVAGLMIQILLSLPNVDNLSYYTPSETSVLISEDGQSFARFHEEENRRVVPLSQISPDLIKAVIAIEDERFYSHHGIDIIGMTRALVKNFLHGRIVEGGSTITQQLARNLYLNRGKTLGRKLAEVILALQIERRFTKEEILEYYLNQIYLGHNAYGVESASELYFGKHAKELDLGEATMIAGLIEGPELYSPYRNLELARARQKVVLKKLYQQGVITQADAEIAAFNIPKLNPENLKRFGKGGAYFMAYVESELVRKYGEDAVNRGGLRVYTTIDMNLQKIAEDIIKQFIEEEGPKYKFTQAALVALDPRNGEIKAMVGGYNFQKSQFNRAVQMKRSPGSAFKPFVYSAALEAGISPGTVLYDRPKTFNVFTNRWNPFGKWTPKNFDGKFRGSVTMRYALEKSLNLPSIELLERVGMPAAISMAKRLGITSHIEPGLSLVLGASEVTPLEITSAYGTLANDGVRVEPTAIRKIVNREGIVIFENKNKGERVLDSNTDAIMIDLMKGVLIRGTGVRGRLSRPAAAKTGTSQEFKDAWTIGFTPQLVCGVWVGNDDNQPMDGVAEVAVCPRIFKAFMEEALVNQPAIDFPQPVGLVNVRICLDSGLLPNQFCPTNRIVTGTFFENDVPLSQCFVHPKVKPEDPEEDDDLGVDPNLYKRTND